MAETRVGNGTAEVSASPLEGLSEEVPRLVHPNVPQAATATETFTVSGESVLQPRVDIPHHANFTPGGAGAVLGEDGGASQDPFDELDGDPGLGELAEAFEGPPDLCHKPDGDPDLRQQPPRASPGSALEAPADDLKPVLAEGVLPPSKLEASAECRQIFLSLWQYHRVGSPSQEVHGDHPLRHGGVCRNAPHHGALPRLCRG